MFGFVQVEFPWALGPPDGRYVVRGHAAEPEHVLVLTTLGARQRRMFGGRRPREAAGEPGPEPVTTARATLVFARAFADEAAADRWLDEADLEAEAGAALDRLNDMLHAHRTAAADPFVREVAREQALVVRVGVGEGEQVAHGRWTKALELPRPKTVRAERRAAALRPQERFAAILGGRDVGLACEELALRARLDLERGRSREAALQLRIALEAGLAELEAWAGRGDLRTRLGELRAESETVAAAADGALQGGLDDEQIADVERVLGRLEAALRARVAGGMD